jgi:hypothetical protein
MRRRAHLSALILLFPALIMNAQSNPPQATIIDTGSTNRPGVIMTINAAGRTEVQPRDAEARKTSIDAHLCERLFEDLKSVGPLSALPKTHCLKSVSFGSSLYVEFNGERSPDLNCPAPPDSKLALLQKDVRDLMDAAHVSSRIHPRTFTATVPHK